MRLLAAAIVTAAALAAGAAGAQDKKPECPPGFDIIVHPHGDGMNFTCRTKVLNCPPRRDHHASIVPDPTLEKYSGIQFAFRCRYTPTNPSRP
jgi:hypothetical protein